MNIAEDIGNPLTVKPHRPTRPRFIQAQIKTFAVEQREYVVKEGILIRKFNLTARGDNKKMRSKHLVLLNKPVHRQSSWYHGRDPTWLERRQPHNDISYAGCIFVLPSSGLRQRTHQNFPGHLHPFSVQLPREYSHQKERASHDHPTSEGAHLYCLLELISGGKRKDVCRVHSAIDGPGPDPAVLRRQNQVCFRSEDQVAADHLLAGT